MLELRPPYHDAVNCVVLGIGEEQVCNVLIITEESLQYPGELVYSGELYLRYGLVYLHKETDALIPQYALDDFRREYHGADALDFLHEKGERFPRADVVGIRVSDGKEAQAYVKELDHARPYRLIACRDQNEYQPICQVHITLKLDRGNDGWIVIKSDDGFSTYFQRSALNMAAHPDIMNRLETLVAQWIDDSPTLLSELRFAQSI